MHDDDARPVQNEVPTAFIAYDPSSGQNGGEPRHRLNFVGVPKSPPDGLDEDQE